MKRIVTVIALCGLLGIMAAPALSQTLAVDDPVLKGIWLEAMEKTQLPVLAHELLDGIGPRLTGSTQQLQAHDWAVAKFQSWGISARKEQYGTWLGWDRGITHVDMTEPWVKTLEAYQLAWSPATTGPVKGSVVIIPDLPDSNAFQRWLPAVKGKFVLVSYNEPTGRPDSDWEDNAAPASFDSLQARRARGRNEWSLRLRRTGTGRNLARALEDAGAAGIISLNWTGGWGSYRVFSAETKKVPHIELGLEDYGLVYRLAESGRTPVLQIEATSKNLGEQPAFNTVAMIRGSEKPDEYVVLMGHFDSLVGATGACDNATGALMMMEAVRILKQVYPNPKRTIVIGLWGSEEQGLNGSRAFVEDHPEVGRGLQAGFNQDNGTGRIVRMSASGFVDAGGFLADWLSRVPEEVSRYIDLTFPGMPSGGGSDHASFIAAGLPAFSLGAQSWSYSAYTWHTQRDTYDKLVFDDWTNNVVLVASLAYLASEDPETVPRTKRVMPLNPRTGQPQEWPAPRPPIRKGGVDR